MQPLKRDQNDKDWLMDYIILDYNKFRRMNDEMV